MTQPSGWYDDPQDPSQLRYWDGVVWSSHVTPKVSPTVGESHIGMPYGVTPAGSRPQAPGSQGAQGPPTVPGGFGSPQQGPQDHGPQDQGQGQVQGPPGGQWPAYPPAPGPMGQQPPGYASQHLPTTPDGVVLSGWWKRVLASILDNIIVSILALPLTFSPLQRVATVMGDWFEEAMNAAEAGNATSPVLPTSQLDGPILQISLTVFVVFVVYEIAFLTRTGATPGKRAVGISVRLRDTPGPPPLVAVLKRTAVKEAGGLVGSLPFLGDFGTSGSVFSLVDVLWPLWDSKKQAIHDKVGATNVVVGPQPKRER